MYRKKLWSYTILFFLAVCIISPVSVGYAASGNDIVKVLSSSTAPVSDSGGGLFSQLFDLLFNKLLGPILNVFNTSAPSTSLPGKPSSPTPSVPSSGSKGGELNGRVIVVDPGHGGNNPGAVDHNTRESDNNLAVGLKLRDKLVQAGAKVIMTRDTDRNVAAIGSSLSTELQARLDIVEANHADIFVSVHTNENSNSQITGATTYYPQGKSSRLAEAIQAGIINSTNAVDKGSLPETFYVLRNNTVPATLVEMGFISNANEAALLASDSYRAKMATGIYNGIVQYFRNS